MTRELPIEEFKESVIELEKVDGDRQEIDHLLGYIYEKDPDFVIPRIRARLNGDGSPLPYNTMLSHFISKNPEPVIKVMEEEIDIGNRLLVEQGGSLIGDVYSSNEKSFEWCKKWKDDERKEKVVIKLLARILTDMRNRDPQEYILEAIQIIKDFGEKKGIDYAHVTKGIKLQKGEEYKEEIFKVLAIVRLMLHPPAKVDKVVLDRVLDNYPFVCKAIGKDWLLDSADTYTPHIFCYLYDWELDLARQEELAKKYDSEKDAWTKAWIGDTYNHNLRRLLGQIYWENVFKTLDEHGIQVKTRELKDNETTYLTEAEIAARLAPHFDVKIKPDIPEFETLDLQIEYNDQKALIEIRTIEEDIEMRVCGTHGVISSIPGGKEKNALLSKFRGQLKEGKIDPGVPVLIMLNISEKLGGPFYNLENALYGQFQFSYTLETNTHTKVQEGSTRAFENAFYRVEGVDIVTAVGAYTRDHTNPSPLVGKLYLPFSSLPPRNPMTTEFRIRLRDALFGDSETSKWKGLLTIEGIDEDTARTFHKNGIEDIDALASAEEYDLEIEGIEKDTALYYQKEAKRVLEAFQTGSIRFLKGMDQEIYDILTAQGVHLIEQILSITDIPEGIDSGKWDILSADARRIRSSNEE